VKEFYIKEAACISCIYKAYNQLLNTVFSL